MRYFSIIILLFTSVYLRAQTISDSVLAKNDSTVAVISSNDSAIQIAARVPFSFNLTKKTDDVFASQLLTDHFFWKPDKIYLKGADNKLMKQETDWIFYVLASLLLLLGILKLGFSRFFSDLFRLFFNTSLKQMQIRERLLQADLPSVFLNLFFVLSGGLYITLVMNYYGVSVFENYWAYFGISTLALSSVYIIKFIALKFSGWLFAMSELTDIYIFIVSLINKMLGVFLLPFTIFIAYGKGHVQKFSVFGSFLLIGSFLIIRFIRSYGGVRMQLKISGFHFFLYLLSFEIIPLLLIYKSLLIYFERSA